MYKYLVLFSLLFCSSNYISATCVDSQVMASEPESKSAIQTFLQNNPNKMTIECLQEENLYLAADDDNLLAVLEVSNPQLLLRFFMKGFSLYIDPTGKKKERFEVKIPAAESLDFEALGLTRREPNSNGGTESEDKPNILPLIDPLIEKGMIYTANRKEITADNQEFSIYLDMDNDRLYYYILIPIQDFFETKKMASNWTIGIYSPEIEMTPDMGQGMMPPPPSNENGKSPEQFAQEISQWISFSFDELSSLNLK